MSHDLQPLVEKLSTQQPISFDDFGNLLKLYRDAMADGRISIREGLRLAFAVMEILREFVDKPTGDTNFGF